MNWKWFLFSFHGRINRKPFWLFSLVMLALYAAIDFAINDRLTFKQDPASLVFTIVFLWPGMAVQTKRWHDRNKSGWWALINLIPVVGGIWGFVETGLLEGIHGENRFGKDPLEGVEKRLTLKRQLTKKEIILAAAVFVFLVLAVFSWLLVQVFKSANK